MLELHEAQLFNLLSSIFGRDQIVYGMSVLAVIGGLLPPDFVPPSGLLLANGIQAAGAPIPDLHQWAKANKCLFAIINSEGDSKMVIEVLVALDTIDVAELYHQQLMRPLMAASGIPYVTISRSEISELLDPSQTLNLVALLQDKLEGSDE